MIYLDAFLDLYYAYDFNRPVDDKRLYTTQPLYHSRPSVNLAHLGVNLSKEKVRGRLALQAGDSVKANTALEADKKLGHIQEAYLGFMLDKRTWIDAGIYLGHIGMESWISDRNLTYGRSLLLDYVPYYSLGVRLGHQVDDKTSVELHVMNGWQNISETNSAKSIGMQLKKKLGLLQFTYNNFFGDERVYPGQKNRFRTYHNFILEKKFSDLWKGAASFDVGTKSQEKNDGTDSWQAGAVIVQRKLSESNALAVRLEHYSDPHQSNVQTFTKHGFVTQSASLNFDHKFRNFLWRSEFRAFKSKDKIYPEAKGLRSRNEVFVTSISFSI
jgi:hypothetical protein